MTLDEQLSYLNIITRLSQDNDLEYINSSKKILQSYKGQIGLYNYCSYINKLNEAEIKFFERIKTEIIYSDTNGRRNKSYNSNIRSKV